MSAAEDVRDAFQGKRGKVLLIGGGLAIVAYVWYTRYNGTPSEVVDPNAQTAVETDSAVRSPQTDPAVGNDTSQSGGSKRPTTNPDWLAQGTDLLVGRGTPAGAASSALGKALEGGQLTTQEIAWVSQVIAALGAPPDGMPPLNSAPVTSSNVKPGGITGLKVIGFSRDAITLDWGGGANSLGFDVRYNNKTYRAGTSSYTASYLKPNTRYTFQVRARPKTGNTYGDWASTTGTTKK